MSFIDKENIKWVQVYKTNTEIDASMIQANLKGAGIPCQVLSQVDSTRMFNVGELAIVKVFVPQEHVEESKQIIDNINSQNVD